MNELCYECSTGQVAAYLRLCEVKVYRLANEGSLTAVRIGKVWRFRKYLLDDWLRWEAGSGRPLWIRC